MLVDVNADWEIFNFWFLLLNISYIDVAPVDIADVARLGAKVAPKVANKFRPLRVQFNNLSHRRTVSFG